MRPLHLLLACLLSCLCLFAAQAQPPAEPAAPKSNRQFASNSVLSSGDWYKLAVTSSGVYRIDKTLLQELGIPVQSINPKQIQLFGNGGGMLPQPNSAPRPDDLRENALMVVGEADDKFDDADYVLFYAQGPHTWAYDTTNAQFTHSYNLYSDTAFYFLRIGAENGKRLATRGQAAGASQTITTYDEHLFHEQDLKKPNMYSGREWYGEEFSSFITSRDFTFAAAGAVPGSDIRLTASLMANSSAGTSFSLQLNGQPLGTQAIAGRGTYNLHPEGVSSSKTYSLKQSALPPSPNFTVSLAFGMGGNSAALGYLNYLELNFMRRLQLYGDQTGFRSVKSTDAAVSTFQIADAPATAMVWDVTDPVLPVQQQTVNANGLSFSTPTRVLHEFVVFRSGSGLKPAAIGKVPNQNLHALNSDGGTDMVIVTHPKFLQQANRLAAYRSQHSGLQVQVVTTQQVYNEFSSGAQDVTAIRDLMRLVYSRSTKPGPNALYLLLFGDASYDYKHRLSNNTNYVPVYESRESLHPINSYSSEDYYGFLDEEEGEWAETSQGDHLLDVGIGRLPAKTEQEAAILVDKIIAYESPGHFGSWRNRITFVADDGDHNEHLEDAEYLADYVENTFPDYIPNKVYLDLFQQEAVANGQQSPGTAAAIDKAVEQGSLIVNYTGHGKEVGWAEENILSVPQINAWKNKDNLTFLLTATCEFGRYDDPARNSGAEAALLHDKGGAVGLITTTRPVYSNSNRVLDRNFFRAAFTAVDGQMPRLGDLVLRTKNNSITDNVSGSRGINNRNFALLGDPSMQLAYPALKAELTHINGKPVAADTLNALGKVTLAGQVSTASGAVATDFNGDLRLTAYEKSTVRKTLGDEDSQETPVQVRENILYDGKATVRNGLFSISFVVPKDIAYNYGHGKITLYASNSTQDAMGANQSVVIGGTAKNTLADTTPPSIRLYMDDDTFEFGGSTSTSPDLVAQLFDESGINTANLGIGHEITAVLDNKQDSLFVLNDYYTASPDSYQKGLVRYSLKGLPPGLHSIRFKAWDTFNNAAEEYIEFVVSNDAKLALEHVLNQPNPFSSNTTFHFDHNRAGEALSIQVQIYTVSGKLVRTLQAVSPNSGAHNATITWDGHDEHNDLLARGVYVYRLTVKSQQDGATTSKIAKLVILN